MELYIRFMTCAALGVIGLGLVMTTMMEGLFRDWDVVADIAAFFRAIFSDKSFLGARRAEDILLEIEKQRQPTVSLRLVDQRRQQLAEIANVESRLNRPQGPVILPMPVPVPAASRP